MYMGKDPLYYVSIILMSEPSLLFKTFSLWSLMLLKFIIFAVYQVLSTDCFLYFGRGCSEDHV